MSKHLVFECSLSEMKYLNHQTIIGGWSRYCGLGIFLRLYCLNGGWLPVIRILHPSWMFQGTTSIEENGRMQQVLVTGFKWPFLWKGIHRNRDFILNDISFRMTNKVDKHNWCMTSHSSTTNAPMNPYDCSE